MTLREIAKKANVSVSTVSRALHNASDISPVLRCHVLETAESMGYLREKKRVQMENRRRDSMTVALLCPEVASVHYAGIAGLFDEALRRRGSRSVMYAYDFQSAELDRLFSHCINASDIDGIFCIGHPGCPVPPCDFPLVFLDGTAEGSVVRMEAKAAAQAMIRFCQQRGYRRLAYAGELLTRGKQDAIRTAAMEAGLEWVGEYTSEKRFDQAGGEAAGYFRERPLPDVILCAYDEIACGLIAGLNRYGITVPGDTAVIGMNDIPMAPYCFGGLTTVHYELESVLDAIVEDMLSDLSEGAAVRREYTVQCHMKQRYTA